MPSLARRVRLLSQRSASILFTIPGLTLSGIARSCCWAVAWIWYLMWSRTMAALAGPSEAWVSAGGGRSEPLSAPRLRLHRTTSAMQIGGLRRSPGINRCPKSRSMSRGNNEASSSVLPMMGTRAAVVPESAYVGTQRVQQKRLGHVLLEIKLIRSSRCTSRSMFKGTSGISCRKLLSPGSSSISGSVEVNCHQFVDSGRGQINDRDQPCGIAGRRGCSGDLRRCRPPATLDRRVPGY
jgi:hypothetical protein